MQATLKTWSEEFEAACAKSEAILQKRRPALSLAAATSEDVPVAAGPQMTDEPDFDRVRYYGQETENSNRASATEGPPAAGGAREEEARKVGLSIIIFSLRDILFSHC